MAHRIAGRRLSRSTSHRLAMFRNQVTDLLRHGKIVTTEAKAKEVRSVAEKVITLGRHGTLHARRQALRIVSDKDVLKKIFDDLGPLYASRPGGYTRIIKLGPRQGDGARMAQLELVKEEGEGEEE
jgi:large subunit ribosomal protein L17